MFISFAVDHIQLMRFLLIPLVVLFNLVVSLNLCTDPCDPHTQTEQTGLPVHLLVFVYLFKFTQNARGC